MKRIVKSILLVCLLSSLLYAQVPGRFMQEPDIHGDRIVFNYEGDLWTVNAAGGTAVRLTHHPGNENRPRFSPDGQRIAFTGGYDAGQNVYLIPASGGVPKRLTYRVQGQVVTWTRDGRIVFRSGHENTYRPIVKLFTVSPQGDMPVQMAVDRGVLCSFNADGSQMVYNRRGREEYYWKRYKGGQYQDIWLADLKAGTFEPVTDYVGKNAYPMWIGDAMYFVSDRGENGISNIYRYDFTSKAVQQITTFEEFDVQMASTDGRHIVFMQAGYLYSLAVPSHELVKVDVKIPTDQWEVQPRVVNPQDYVHGMAIDDDGKIVTLEARGDLYRVPVHGGEPVNLTGSCGSRERYPQVSPDGQTLAFFSDKTGEYALYTMPVAGGAWTRRTDDLKNTMYHLEWSPDSKKILFGNKDFALFLVDLATGKTIKVDESNQLKNDEFYWEISDYAWSPDSEWIVYSQVQFNRNSALFLYNLKSQKRHQITNGFYDDLNPRFDLNGDYLYYLSYRNYTARMDVFEDNHVIPNPVQVMAMALKDGQAPPFEGEATPKASGAFRIDLEGLARRTYVVPVEAGNYFYLKAGRGLITWASRDDWGEDEYEAIYKPTGRANYKLHLFDMAKRQEAVLDREISDWRLSHDGSQIIVSARDRFTVGDVKQTFAAKKVAQPLRLDRLTYKLDPRTEWLQIFDDTWRWYRDFFYDANMHGRDWAAIGAKFRAMVPELTSRNDLNWVLSQMVGELCVSHTYVGGGDRGPHDNPRPMVFTGLLGADLVAGDKGFFQFKTLLGPTDINRELTSPLVRPDIQLQEGDYLIAINGHVVKSPENPYQYLQVTRGESVQVTVNDQPAEKGARTYTVQPTFSEYVLRYNRWLQDNVDKTLALSGGKVGYMHITAMSSGNTAQFDRFWRAFRYLDGLIIDVRGNGGGWTEYFLIDKLERKMTAYNVLKNMEPMRYPGSVHTGPIALLSNEYNGSDGEAFVEHFKARKLGTVIGEPSWGGLVGIINGQTTIDNGTVHQSNNSFFGRDGKWLVENHGADPDIVLMNDPASVLAGHDKQLETAVELLLKQIKENPFSFPARPAYPVR